MTENSIHRLLNPQQVPPSLRAPTPAGPEPNPSGAGGGTEASADPTAMQSAARTVPEVNSYIKAGGKVFPPETDQAAGALGSGWATADAMKQVSSGWLQALNRMVDEIEYLGDGVERCATNWKWAEAEMEQNINQIRTGAH